MVQSRAATVEEYLDELPDERRAVVSEVLDVVRRNMPPGYEEKMNWGMITWQVPRERYPNTYNKQPLGYVALTAQKNYYSLHLMSVYENSDKEQRLRTAFQAAGKKLDMGKSCVRFRKLDDLPLAAVGDIIASTPVEETIAAYERSRHF